MDPRHAHHGRLSIRHALHMALGCCLGFLLLAVVAPFAGPWGPVLLLAALLGCVLMAVFHRHGPAPARLWRPGRRDAGDA